MRDPRPSATIASSPWLRKISPDAGPLLVGQHVKALGPHLGEVGALRDRDPVGGIGQEGEGPLGLFEVALVAGDMDQTLPRPLSGEGAKGLVPVRLRDLEEKPGRLELFEGDAADARIRILLGEGGEEIHLAFRKLAHGLGADLGVGALPLWTQAVEQAHETTISLVSSTNGTR